MHKIILVLLITLPSFALSAPDAVITIHPDQTYGKLNRWVFGANLIGYQVGCYGDTSPVGTNMSEGMWNPEKSQPVPEMVQAAKKAGVSVARWPGGCGVHTYNWKKTIGPVSERPDQKFGLPEYLLLCKSIGAEPLITLADYAGTASDAADLVEYLNFPNDGKHPWAKKRADDGHPAPWNVTWFEYGNESEHGLHTNNDDFGKSKRFTPEQYANGYLEYRIAMRAVSTRIKLGAVVATGFPDLSGWATTVCKRIGPTMDFAIHHSYKVSYSGNDGKPDARTIFQIEYSAAPQIQTYYDQMNALLRSTAGYKVPIAVTEFNSGFVQDSPVPYRHTLGNAIHNADMLSVFLNPKNNIIMANFWEFANEYWGQVAGFPSRGEKLQFRPQYYPFLMYTQHFGEALLKADVVSSTFNTIGGLGVQPTNNKGSIFKLLGQPQAIPGNWTISEISGYPASQVNGAVTVQFNGKEDFNYYHASISTPAKPDTDYQITGEIKTTDISSLNGASLQVGDTRGWIITKSAIISEDVKGTSDWKIVKAFYRTLPDTSSITVSARRISGGGPISGTASYRNVRIQQYIPACLPATPFLGVTASKKKDGTICLMVVNRNVDAPITTSIRIPTGQIKAADAWQLSGDLDATNEKNPDKVKVSNISPKVVSEHEATITFPAHSLTAIELR